MLFGSMVIAIKHLRYLSGKIACNNFGRVFRENQNVVVLGLNDLNQIPGGDMVRPRHKILKVSHSDHWAHSRKRE